MDPIKQRFDDAYRQITASGSPWELASVELEGRAFKAFRNAASDIRELFAAGRAHGDREFLVYEGERWSFTRLFALADAISNALILDAAVAKGDRVAIAMRNYPEWIAAFIGITSAGAVAVPLNSWGRTEELEYALDDAGARVVFCDHQRLEYLAPRLGERGSLAIVARSGPEAMPEHSLTLESFVSGHTGATAPHVSIAPHDLAMMLYTSGTTGKPKGAASTHLAVCQAVACFECSGTAAAMANPEAIGAMMQSGFAPTVMLAYPLFHVSGLYSVFMLSLRAGRRIVMMYKWDVANALEYIETERVTMFTGAPSMLLELLESPDFAGHDTSSLMSLGAGGAATPGKLAKLMFERVRNPFPGAGWGMTETNALGSSFTGQAFGHRMGSSGFVQPIIELRFLDEEGEEVPQGVPGHIWLKSITLIQGYWNRPDANAKEFRDGWFNTGDIGYLDSDGYLFLSDRAKDMVIRGGENVYPLEIESTLMNRPDVIETVAFGVPDEQMGEEVALIVRTAAGADLDADTVRAWLRERLTGFKVPRYVEFASEPLPRNVMQKILKKDIRADFLRRHGHA